MRRLRMCHRTFRLRSSHPGFYLRRYWRQVALSVYTFRRFHYFEFWIEGQ